MGSTEVRPKTTRRTYSAGYKRRILREAADCQPGEIGALLRREGIYSSQLSTWRRQHEQGGLRALGRRRGRRPSKPSAQEFSRLRKENARLKEELRKAHLIMEAQKKISPAFSIRRSEPGAAESMKVILELAEQVSKVQACKAFNVPRSSFYRAAQPDRPVGTRRRHRAP